MKYFVAFILILALSTHAAAQTPTTDTDYWLAEYARLEASYRAQWDLLELPCLRYPTRDGTALMWGNAMYALPSYLWMYEWGMDTVWLDRFVERADQIISYAVDGWPSIVAGQPWSIDLAIAGVLMRFANVTAHIPAYDEPASRYREIALQMGEKWHDLGDTIPPPYNLLAVAGMYHYEMGDTEQTAAILRTIEGAMRPHPTRPGALVWNYSPVSSEVEDSPHAGIVIAFLAQAKPELIPALRETALGVWRGEGRFWFFIDSTLEPPADQLPYYDWRAYNLHGVLGTGMYEAITDMWKTETEYFRECRPGYYMAIPALMLLHNFPQSRVYLPVVWR